MSGRDRKRRRRQLRQRDGDVCGICRLPLDGEISIDHIVSRANGGTNQLENLQLTHYQCNMRKNKLVDQKLYNQVQLNKENKMAKLELALLVGDEGKKWLTELEQIVTRFEVALDKAGAPAKRTATTAAETEVEEKTTINAKTVSAKANGKTTTKKAAAVEEADFDLGDSEAAADETPTITKADLIAACRENREAAIKVLKKMKVSSVHELKPAQYSTVLQQIGAN